MNITSRTLLQTILATDGSLTVAERTTAQRLCDGQAEAPAGLSAGIDERLLVTQKQAAEMLGVSRVTIWRMTKECVLHPVEILPGTWRYSFREVVSLAKTGISPQPDISSRLEPTAA